MMNDTWICARQIPNDPEQKQPKISVLVGENKGDYNRKFIKYRKGSQNDMNEIISKQLKLIAKIPTVRHSV